MSEEKGLVQQLCSKIWWIVLLRGVALLILGGLLLSKPGITAILLMMYLGAYFLVDGVFVVFHSISGRKYMEGWGWGLLMGVLEILAALVVFSQPLVSTILTANFLVYYVAFMAIVLGVFGIITGIKVRKEIQGEWAMIVGGVLAIIFGIILLINPSASAVIYLQVMGVCAIVAGIAQIITSFSIRKIGKQGLASLAD